MKAQKKTAQLPFSSALNHEKFFSFFQENKFESNRDVIFIHETVPKYQLMAIKGSCNFKL